MVLSDPSPTYIVVTGTDFGTDLASISASQLEGNGNADIPLIPYALTNTYAVFKIANQSVLVNGATYDLQITFTGYPMLSDVGAYISEVMTTGGLVPTSNPTATYTGQVITSDLEINGTDRNQLTTTEAADPATTVVVSGVNLVQGNLSAEVVREDGTAIVVPAPVIVVAAPDANGIQTATVTLPAGLTENNYILKFFDNDLTNPETLIAQYPFTIVNPAIISMSPNIVPVSDLTPPKEITVAGSFLGRDESLLEFKFTSDESNMVVAQVSATSIQGGTQATFNAPANLTKGTYTVTMLYNSTELGNPLEFTVASEAAKLVENLTWSKAGKYKVFDFSVDLPIPTEKFQLVQFKFYNTAADNIPPTTFTFNYTDPNLPYVDHVSRRTTPTDAIGINISDKTTTEINEQPATLFIYTDTKANKLNVYLGDTYNSSSVPYKTFIGPTDYTVVGTTRKFTLNLEGVPNGTKKLTIVPSLDGTLAPPNVKSGENSSGLKSYDMVFTSTPYMIVNNAYNGMVIKADTEISCTGVLTGCISGRLVNVPGLADLDDLDDAVSKVEFYVNNELSLTLTQAHIIDPSLGTFRAPFATLEDGKKNTLSFIIYLKQNGVFTKITETKIDIFKFSTTAAEFGDIKPIETGDVVKYPAGTAANTFSTSETTVSL